MSTNAHTDTQEERLQKQLRIARMKAQLGKVRMELWMTRLPVIVTGGVLLLAAVCMALVTVVVVHRVMH